MDHHITDISHLAITVPSTPSPTWLFDGIGKGRVLADVKKFFFPSTRNLSLGPFILVGVPEGGLGAQ
jgi:hypothetical protein